MKRIEEETAATAKRGAGIPEQVAIVTGTTSGFGLHICIELARSGVIVIAGMRRPEAGGELKKAALGADRGSPAESDSAADKADRDFAPAADLEPLGEGPVSRLIRPIRLDVCDENRVREAVELVAAEYGRIDILVNNAGMAMGGFIEEIPQSGWREQFEVNVFGLIAMTSAVIPHMREARRGCIVQMSSVSGAIGLPGYGPYVSSKFAVEGFSETLALELAPYGVRTYVLEPASYRTPIWDKGFAGIHRAENSPNAAALDRMLDMSRASAESGGDPRDVAKLAADLALGRRGRGRFRYVVPRGAALLAALKKRLPFRLVQAVMLRILRRGMKPPR
ncbi:SDR family NAD(P)-dependent oxidoreductase [Saccharibacillus sp. CPCC 101409]|uniref:SDR family NAD(P)-dependent oxidoreductase n=1 Tax=Saccharibacillus sp. CPCC 101409 TaxID=3058041 RepID=UPI002671DFC9|nr:SDR family NAD(P)-dependent oxidoreductase [Saccharibacillus sp. CPCC 101409]MDO3411088.1 SDR family NAD(P)-dependent oxidoreductase [Saccharibacillus sp. CPCC 101409]